VNAHTVLCFCVCVCVCGVRVRVFVFVSPTFPRLPPLHPGLYILRGVVAEVADVVEMANTHGHPFIYC
jgi:hypothetical protein